MSDYYVSQRAVEERLNRLERESYHNSVLWPDHVEECREAIRDIPPEEVRPVKWIPVTERLPETYTFVLACFDDVQVIAFYGNYQWNEAFSNQVFYPSHWMPLPEFPKEEP